ncbi:hydantoinase B/oxoprolinase family protein [Thermodesulfobacteriota bacterium]
MSQSNDVDPIRYEMFRHRLFNIAEEGRIAIQQVSGSPAVVEGGECMSSFYDRDGTVIITAAGLLLHCTGCQDAIKKTIEWDQGQTGIHAGDQFFFNDPYIAATHVYDMLVVKPIFYNGRRIAWTASMMHTADTGGVLRGGATEIFHEGIRFQGIKIVERGEFRKDVFRNIVEQCRDPQYVGLDLKAKIASNNVCAQAFLKLVEQYGVGFVEKAGSKIIADSEKMARAKLRSLPDGTWRSRIYAFSHGDGKRKLFKVVCTMKKFGDEATFDFSGTSPQNNDATNCSLPCSWSSFFNALAGFLFWDVPWNGGMVAPVKLIIPEGTVLNCNFPAACGLGPATGGTLTTAAQECITKMLYAGGHYDDVNAAWCPAKGGEFRRFGGKNQYGGVVVQQIYDFFANGLGGTPQRDGVHTGCHVLNPQSKISDVELIEMNYPLLYLSRNQVKDSGGYGKYPGGMGMERIMIAYGTQDLTDNYWPPHGIPWGHGLFGGYPSNTWEQRFFHSKGLKERLAASEYPTGFDDITRSGFGEPYSSDQTYGRIPVKEYDFLADRAEAGGGGGFGDPLDRDPQAVLNDVREEVVSLQVAAEIYGCAIDPKTLILDDQATTIKRKELFAKRRLLAQEVHYYEDNGMSGD